MTLDSIYHFIQTIVITLSYHIHSAIAQANIACVYFFTSSISYICFHYFLTALCLFCSLNISVFPSIMIDSKTQSCLDITRTNRIETLWYDNDCIKCEYVNPYSLDFKSCLQSNDFSIMQFNIRGLLSKEDQLNRLLNKIGSKNKVSVVALNKTWLRKENINKVSLPGYNLEHNIRKGKKGGGVTIAIHKSLKYRCRLNLELSLDTIDHVWIELKTNTESILICCAYRLPNMNAKQFCEEYESLSQVQKKLNK